ncbi:reverse transcriptase domain-containing protein [Tanacetum coccineum]
MKADGTIDKYKARLVIKGFRQCEGLDFFDTYLPVTRITSIRMVLAIAALRKLEVHQMDMKMTFLNGDLENVLYMNQPEGFMAPGLESKVYIHEGGDESVLSTQEYIRKVVDDMSEDEDFKGGSWVSAVEFVNANGGGIMNGCLGDIENYLKNGKLEQVVAIIKSCTLNALGDLTVTLKDLSGSTLILANVSIFSLKPSMHYLNITMRNVVKIFHKDSVPGNGSGVSGSGMSDEEEIMKLLKEEEMADLELQVCGNVIDRKNQYKLDGEALNLAFEEEARAE